SIVRPRWSAQSAPQRSTARRCVRDAYGLPWALYRHWGCIQQSTGLKLAGIDRREHGFQPFHLGHVPPADITIVRIAQQKVLMVRLCRKEAGKGFNLGHNGS